MYRQLSLTIAGIILSGFLAGPAASADDTSCWLEAKNTVYLSIDDLDRQGNILMRMWRGVLTEGNKKHIQSANGKIRYYTSPSGTSSSPGIDLTCTNNETIGVP
jgi:hypothetical protein